MDDQEIRVFCLDQAVKCITQGNLIITTDKTLTENAGIREIADSFFYYIKTGKIS